MGPGWAVNRNFLSTGWEASGQPSRETPVQLGKGRAWKLTINTGARSSWSGLRGQVWACSQGRFQGTGGPSLSLDLDLCAGPREPGDSSGIPPMADPSFPASYLQGALLSFLHCQALGSRFSGRLSPSPSHTDLPLQVSLAVFSILPSPTLHP